MASASIPTDPDVSTICEDFMNLLPDEPSDDFALEVTDWANDEAIGSTPGEDSTTSRTVYVERTADTAYNPRYSKRRHGRRESYHHNRPKTLVVVLPDSNHHGGRDVETGYARIERGHRRSSRSYNTQSSRKHRDRSLSNRRRRPTTPPAMTTGERNDQTHDESYRLRFSKRDARRERIRKEYDIPVDRITGRAIEVVSAAGASVTIDSVRHLDETIEKLVVRYATIQEGDSWASGGCFPGIKQNTSWPELMLYGHELYRTFESYKMDSRIARALRERVIRGESLIEALESADELLTWIKMLAAKNLPIYTNNPIVATSKSLLENLKLKLGPFVRCLLLNRDNDLGSRTLPELLRQQRFSDITCITTYMFVMIARIANIVVRGSKFVEYDDISCNVQVLQEYTPGSCLAGVLEALITHQRECGRVECTLSTWAGHLSDARPYGKYFKCSTFNC
uniref:ORF4 n=1 Tax=Human herpesvirus 3 TaxID=10335 RepID=U5NPR6_HHV3|nr:ORF4 [Human alphaherpesvirus 3]